MSVSAPRERQKLHLLRPTSTSSIGLRFALVALVLGGGRAGADESLEVIIVAGQSNAINWHSAAAVLPADPIDASIPFFHRSGAPPDRGFRQPVNASSGGQWITLQPQEQEPYVKYERRFFGPEITLGRRLSDDGRRSIAVIKIAYFGTSLAEDWNPEAMDGSRLYGDLVARAHVAIDQLTSAKGQPRVTGFFWMQGETDGAKAPHAEAYAKNIGALIAAVRRDFEVPDLPVVLGRVGPRPPSGYLFQDAVRRAQVAVAERDSAVAWVDTDDLPRDTDEIHLLGNGVIALGERMAAAWLELKGNKVPAR